MSGFGGVLPWARRTLVERDKILTSEEFSAILGICQIVPGPNIMKLAGCVGTRFAGARGALADSERRNDRDGRPGFTIGSLVRPLQLLGIS